MWRVTWGILTRSLPLISGNRPSTEDRFGQGKLQSPSLRHRSFIFRFWLRLTLGPHYHAASNMHLATQRWCKFNQKSQFEGCTTIKSSSEDNGGTSILKKPKVQRSLEMQRRPLCRFRGRTKRGQVSGNRWHQVLCSISLFWGAKSCGLDAIHRVVPGLQRWILDCVKSTLELYWGWQFKTQTKSKY